jgi:hypothetical protein
MKKPITILILTLLSLTNPSLAQQWNWVSTAGSNNADVSKHLTLDPNNNPIVIGVFHDSLFTGVNKLTSRGNSDIFIAKFDPTGNLLWARSGGGPYSDGDYSMGVTTDSAGNIYVACSSSDQAIFAPDTVHGASSSIVLLKYDSNGNHLLTRYFGGSGADFSTDVDVDYLGNIILIGAFQSTIDFGTGIMTASGQRDYFIAKFNSNGQALWARRGGGAGDDNGGGVVSDDRGNIYVTGYYNGPATFDSLGSTVNGVSVDDAFVLKYDTSGIVQWINTGTGIGQFDAGNKICIDAQNDVYVAGQFSNDLTFDTTTIHANALVDGYIAKFLTSNGQLRWITGYGGNGDDISFDINSVSEGLNVTGQFTGQSIIAGDTLISNGGSDIFVLRCSYYGILVWAKQTGGPGDDAGRGVESHSSYECFVAGSFSSTVPFDGFLENSNGNSDMYVGRLTITFNEINDVSNPKMILYPNPATNRIRLRGIQSNQQYRIFSVLGNNTGNGHVNPGQSEIDLSQLESGIYFLVIGVNAFRFVKE